MDAIATVRIGQSLKRQDPLRWFRFGVPRIRQALAMFVTEEIRELHLRACNKGGKTLSAAAFVIACCQKRQELDGCPIPQWAGPIEAVQLTLDFPQQILSVRPAYMRLLGKWPHRAKPQSSDEPLESLLIMPEGGNPNDTSGWSTIRFLSQKNMESGKGVRADVVAFDEPPKMDILNELRKAPHAGRPGVRLIAETPIRRREWAWLREDYGDSPRRSIRRVDKYRAECRWSLSDVEKWVLSDEEKQELLATWALNPALKDAREHGDYTSDGGCPLNVAAILAMMEHCLDPELSVFTVPRETLDQYGAEPVAKVTVEVWDKPKPGKRYYIAIDPASGIDDSKHNPAGLHVTEMGSGDLAARWNGYLSPHTVGGLAAILSRQYNDAGIDIEMKDHWGVNVVRGVQDGHCGGRLLHEMKELSPGKWSKEIGWDANEENRAIAIGQIQEWLDSYQAGVSYATCRSRAVLNCLLDTELDERGKIVAGPGVAHGEDMVLRGQSLRRCVSRTSRFANELQKPPPTQEEKRQEVNKRLVDRIMGRNGVNGHPDHQLIRKPRNRPR